jgi:hypothetical protein
VTLSVPRSLDSFFRDLADRVVEVNGKKIRIVKSRNEVYVNALEFSLLNVGEWADVKRLSGDGV